MTTDTTLAYFAGFLSGRGGFDTNGHNTWAYFITLDREVADEAVRIWGGYATARATRNRAGKVITQWKWAIEGRDALEVLSELTPHLRGHRRGKAEALLERYAAA